MHPSPFRTADGVSTRVARGSIAQTLGRRCGLRGINAAMGELRTMETLRMRLPRSAQAKLDELVHYGVCNYRHADDSVFDLAERAARATLIQTGLCGKEIDLILFATETHGGEDHVVGLAGLCARLGVHEAPLAVISGYECGNLGIALGQAVTEVAGNWARRVLVIAADRCQSDSERLCTPPIALMSDGAVACIVDAEPSTSLVVRSVRSVFNHGILGEASAQSLPQIVQAMLKLFRRAAADVLGPAAVLDRPTRLFTNNVSQALLDMVQRLYGLSAQAVCNVNLARDGHLYGADPLINCADYLAGAERVDHCPLGLLFFGRSSATFIALECLE